ncbi:MAG: sugar transferase [Candidatus Riflebacteria bacterium]|nr:sugar transferase [Candidatus Riflebacteria bacterium]
MSKRIFDLFFSFLGLFFLSPVLMFVACRIKQFDKGPVFYRGVRVGKGGTLFRIFKFRTMVIDAEKKGPSSTSEEDLRITKIGKVLRKYKLDELPQLINVLLGEMSFVGPRPQVEWAVKLYTEEEKKLLSVNPGITDLASLKFSNEGELLRNSDDPDKFYMENIHPEKVRLSLKYVQNSSVLVDFKIVLFTIGKLIFPNLINGEPSIS